MSPLVDLAHNPGMCPGWESNQKNNLKVTRGEVRGDNGEKGFQDTWTKPRGKVEAREGGVWLGWGGVVGGKIQTTVK